MPQTVIQQQQQQQAVNKASSSKAAGKPPDYRLFVSLFEYDPVKMSPNTDCSEELPFNEGQLIKVFGDQDADGFYYGESNGRSGFIPCNMIEEVQDPDIIKQFTNEQIQLQQQQQPPPSGKQQSKMEQQDNRKSSVIKADSYDNKKSSKNQQQQQQPTTNKQQQQSSSSFMPINRQQTNQQQQQPPVNSNHQIMIALYDYDPQSLSPNVDVDVELSFKTGDIITIIGDMDEDGFYMGALNGKQGLVPSNFLQPLDQYQREQEMNMMMDAQAAAPSSSSNANTANNANNSSSNANNKYNTKQKK
jgi:RIMS-binding protein 2